MRTLKLKDILPVSISLVISILHKNICEIYSDKTKTNWEPVHNDYFYMICVRLIYTYKKCNRKMGILLKNDYLNKLVEPPGSPCRIDKKKGSKIYIIFRKGCRFQ